jgi:hypothetical protein
MHTFARNLIPLLGEKKKTRGKFAVKAQYQFEAQKYERVRISGDHSSGHSIHFVTWNKFFYH